MTNLPLRSPETEALERECELLREELARLLVERAWLLEVEAPALEARYLVALGALQLEVLVAECDVRRLKRKMELLWRDLNRGRLPDLIAIETRLDDELAEWRVRLRVEAARLIAARERVAAPMLSVQEIRELRELFRGLAKRCHPDANPEGGDRARQLWHQASDAYARGDLNTLRALALLTDDVPVPEASEEVVDILRQRRDTLAATIARLLTEIEEIGARFPFSIRERLDDPDWLASKRAELERRLAELVDERLLLEATLARILFGGADV